MKSALKDGVKFTLLAVIIYAIHMSLSWAPNIHIVSSLMIAVVLVYRRKSLYTIAIYSLIEGIAAGFQLWWFPYIYVWHLIYILTCAIAPVYKDDRKHIVIYALISALHGLMFGFMYGVMYCPMMGMSIDESITWFFGGVSFYIEHAISNFLTGFLVIPVAKCILFCENKINHHQLA